MNGRLLTALGALALIIAAALVTVAADEDAPASGADERSGEANEVAGSEAAGGATAMTAADSLAAAREMEVGKLLVQRCAQCHGEGRPAAGLSLEWADFPGSLVGVGSTQVDTLLLVEPGSPDRSYLVWKLENHDGIRGNRMPTGPKPLPDGQIQMVRSWITALQAPPADTTGAETR
jgi:hypothetical protein